MLQGDILIRCRHLTDAGGRVSMFRAAFHTGYIPLGILRLTKGQLDGACQDNRFASDFFVDLIFAPVQSTASDGPDGRSEGVALSAQDKHAYDDMLTKDEQFWTDVDQRKARMLDTKQDGGTKKKMATTFSIVDDVHVEYERKGSWDEGREKDLMDALKAAVPLPSEEDDGHDGHDDGVVQDKILELEDTADDDATFDFADDDFDELEKYLTTLTTNE
ncbi:hypothetical protein DYB25_012331 [Aphanomyces astaci]|nr:hypothetical protein DYB25_012331 [Aphanomyces astaci]